MSKPLPVPPRGLDLPQSAAYWGVSPGTFKKLVERGIVPRPMRLVERGKQIFDRIALDRAWDAHSKIARAMSDDAPDETWRD